MNHEPHFLTPAGKDKLEKELEHLTTVRRLQVAALLRAAIEEGDLSENAGYDEAKREQAFLEGRIKEIAVILRNVRILVGNESKDIVGLGSQVTVTEVGSDHEETYMIVGSVEADPAGGRVSNESPLGQSLLGRRVGDTVEVSTPGGSLQFEVRSIN